MKPRTKSIAFTEWSASARAAWRFGLLRRIPRLSTASQRLAVAGYGYWLFGGRVSGQFDVDAPPESQCNAETIRGYVEHLQNGLKPASVHTVVKALNCALSILAPNMDRQFVSELLRSLPHASNCAKKRMRLRESAELLALGMRLMGEAEAGVHPNPHKNAVTFRDGFAIALRALRPCRPKNFAEIEIDKHLIRENGERWLDFAADETKTRVPSSMLFPAELITELDLYLNKYRPLLTMEKYSGPRLWISYQYRPLTQDGLYLAVVKRTAKAFGQAIYPNLFRDAAMSSLAAHSPKMVRVGSVVLGHGALETGERYYRHAKSIEAGRKLLKALDSIRSRAGRRRRSRPTKHTT